MDNIEKYIYEKTQPHFDTISVFQDIESRSWNIYGTKNKVRYGVSVSDDIVNSKNNGKMINHVCELLINNLLINKSKTLIGQIQNKIRGETNGYK